MEDVIIEEADKYQDFFNFMKNDHNLILTISEMNDIISESKELSKKLNRVNINKKEALNCNNPYCENGVVAKVYGEKVYCKCQTS